MISKNLFLSAVFLASTIVTAAPLPPLKTHSFSVGLEGGHAHYWNWFDNQQPYEDIGGLMGGFMGDYTFTLNNYFAKVDVHAQWGKNKYSATIQKGGFKNVKGTLNNARTNMVETRLIGGRSFDLYEDLRIAPYVGVGYRTFNRANLMSRYLDSDPSIPGQSFYEGDDMRTHHIYLPIGATITKALDDTWQFTATGEFNLLIDGNGLIREDDGVSTPNSSQKVPQNHGFGLKAEMAIVRQMNKMSLSVGPYVTYWSIGRTDKGSADPYFTLMYRTLETGLRIKFSF